MSKRKSGQKATAEPEWGGVDPPSPYDDYGELAYAISELSRQVQTLGRIIDELVNEFHWQNNQVAEKSRAATDFHKQAVREPADQLTQPARRTTLFE